MRRDTDFGREEAIALQAILDLPSRPKDAMRYLETAGFLFAVCCNPDMVQPSEWLPEVLGRNFGDLANLEEAQRTLDLLMRLHNDINRRVLARNPALPWGCEMRDDPLANLEDDAPLSCWARGFGQGWDWLYESWPDDLPGDLDDGLGACMMVLTFFAKRSLAHAYWKESDRTGVPFEAMVKTMQEMLIPTMAAYADLGRSLYEGWLTPKPPRKTRKSRARRPQEKHKTAKPKRRVS